MGFIATPISTVTTGAPATSTWANSVKTELDYLTSLNKSTNSRPFALLTQTATQSIPNGSWTSLLFDTEVADVGNGHSTSSSTQLYTPPTTGWFFVVASVTFATNSTSDRRVQILYNGGQIMSQSSARACNAGETIVQCSVIMPSATTTIEARCFQDSGGSLSTAVDVPSFLSVYWLNF